MVSKTPFSLSVHRHLKRLFFISWLAVMAGCSAYSNSALTSLQSYSPFSGRASAGPISAGKVTIYKTNSSGVRGDAVATATTDANGNYTVNVPTDAGPVIVAVSGGSYVEEATGAVITLGSNEITAVVSSSASAKTVSVTPLTHLAAERAITLAANGVDVGLAMTKANAAIALAAGLSATDDITAVLPAMPGVSLAAQGLSSTSTQAKYALFLAALSQYGHDNGGQSSLAVMTSFAADFKNDGRFNTTGTAWSSDLATAQTSYIANPINNGVFSGASNTTPVSTPPTPTPSVPWAGIKYLGVSGRTTTGIAGTTTDFEGNVFVAGSTDANLDAGTYIGSQDMQMMVSKYNSAGILQWTRLLSSGVSTSISAYSLVADGSGNVIVVGTSSGPIPGSAATSGGPFVVKYNSAGVLQWSQQISANARGRKVAVDLSGNIFMAGMTSVGLDGNTLTGSNDIFLVKYTTAGAKLWTRQFGPPSGATGAMDIMDIQYGGGGLAIDHSGNAFLTGTTDGDISGNGKNGNTDSFIAKYDGAGVRQWVKQFGAGNTYANSLTIDSQGNLLVVGSIDTAYGGQSKSGNLDAFVAKFNSSGTAVWTRLLGAGGSRAAATGVVTDEANNIYITGGSTDNGINGLTQIGDSDLIAAKYNSSGSLQWTREIGSASSQNTQAYGLSIDFNGDLYLSGLVDGVAFGGAAGIGINDAYVVKFSNAGVQK